MIKSDKTTLKLAKILESDKPAVLIFLDTECPICQKYTKNIKDYCTRYDQVQWIGVFTRWHSPEQIIAFRETYDLQMAMYLDPKNKLVRRLGIAVTPEIAFFDPDRKLLYQGAIDNWFFGLGKHRPAATENYLTDAIEAWSRGDVVKISRTTAIGCIIER